MKPQVLLKSLIFGTMGIAGLAGYDAYAQAPGGGAPQSMPQQQPQSNPGMNNPDMNNPNTMTQKVDDKKFAKDAAMGGMMEVELGKLAAQKGGSDAVKQFGQKMVDDHSKANDQLKEVASSDSLQLPSAVDSKQQSQIDKMSSLSGAAFDKAYVKDMLKDHEKDVHAFQLEAQNGHDPKIKQFAAITLPTLKEHLSAIKDLQKQEKSSK